MKCDMDLTKPDNSFSVLVSTNAHISLGFIARKEIERIAIAALANGVAISLNPTPASLTCGCPTKTHRALSRLQK